MNTNTETWITLLSDPDGTQRRQAALQLGGRREPQAAAAIVERLRTEADPHVREDLTWAAVQLIEDTEPTLIGWLASDSPHERLTAAHVLSKVGSPAHYEAVVGLLDDSDADVRIKAYRAVANTGRPEAPAALARNLGVRDGLERDALVNALATLGADSVPAIAAALSDGDSDVREHAAEALGHIGEEAASADADLARATGDADAGVRLAAVAALAQIGEPGLDHLNRLTAGEDARIAAVAKAYLALSED